MVNGPAIPHNGYFLIRGSVCKFDRQLPDERLQFLAHDSGAALILSSKEFLQGWLTRTIMQCVEPDPGTKNALLACSTLTEHDRAVVDRKLRYVLPVEKARKEMGIRLVENDLLPIVLRVAQENGDATPPHYKTVALWHRQLAATAFNDSTVLRHRYRKPGPPQRRLDVFVAQIIESAICEVYLNRQEYDIQAVYDAVVAAIGRKNSGLPPELHLKLPHRSTVYRWVASVDGYLAKRFRQSKGEADAAYKPVYAGPKAFAPNDVWEIDHHRFDTMVVSSTGIPIGRPWLTTALDRCTRVVVGYYLTFDPPSTHSVMMCLRHAIMPKLDLREKFPGVESDYPYYGLPKTIVVDNGADFHSASFKEACRGLLIHLEYAEPYCPEWKGRIERFFRTLARFSHRMPGTTKPRERKRKKHDPADDAIITIDALDELLIKFLLEDYCMSPHRGIGNTPRCAWIEAAFRPQLPADARSLDVLLMCVEERVLGHDGINFRRLKYGGAHAARIRAAAGVDSIKVKIKYDPTDLGAILVEDPKSGEFVIVPCLNPEYAKGLSVYEHKAILAAANENLAKKVDIVKLCTKRDDMRRLMASALNESDSMRERSKAVRWLKLAQKGLLIQVLQESGLDGDKIDKLEVLPDDPTSTTEPFKRPAKPAKGRRSKRVDGPIIDGHAVNISSAPPAAAEIGPDEAPGSHSNADADDLDSLFEGQVENFTGKIDENEQ